MRKSHLSWVWCLSIVFPIAMSAVAHPPDFYGKALQMVDISPFTQSLLPISERKGLATDYNTLVFYEGTSIYSFDLVNQRLRVVVEDISSRLWDVSAESNALAFKSDRGDLYLVNIDGTALQQVTRDEGEITALSWSPSGDRLAYVVEQKELHILDYETREDKLVGMDEERAPCYSVKWLADNRHLLYDACVGSVLYLVDADSSVSVDLSNGLGSVFQFWPSPDGQKVVFSTEKRTARV